MHGPSRVGVAVVPEASLRQSVLFEHGRVTYTVMCIVAENEKNTKSGETSMAVSTHRNGWFLVAVGHVLGVAPKQRLQMIFFRSLFALSYMKV